MTFLPTVGALRDASAANVINKLELDLTSIRPSVYPMPIAQRHCILGLFLLLHNTSSNYYLAFYLLGPFHGAIAVPSVTRCRCCRRRRRRRRGHRCAGACDSGGVRQ